MQALRDPEGGMHGLCKNTFVRHGIGHVDYAQMLSLPSLKLAKNG